MVKHMKDLEAQTSVDIQSESPKSSDSESQPGNYKFKGALGLGHKSLKKIVGFLEDLKTPRLLWIPLKKSPEKS